MGQTVIPPGSMQVDGYPIACGATPTFLVGPELGDTAKANPTGIYINWPAFSGLPTGVKAFVYAHECGHMLYGPDENVADAFAIRLGRSQGWINLPILQDICATVFFSPGDWTHLPGPLRCRQMANYFAY